MVAASAARSCERRASLPLGILSWGPSKVLLAASAARSCERWATLALHHYFTLATIDPPRTRTWNLRLRRPTPYPLGQRAGCVAGRAHGRHREGVCARGMGWEGHILCGTPTPGHTPVCVAHATPHHHPPLSQPGRLRLRTPRFAPVRAGTAAQVVLPHLRAALAGRLVPCGAPKSVVCVCVWGGGIKKSAITKSVTPSVSLRAYSMDETRIPVLII